MAAQLFEHSKALNNGYDFVFEQNYHAAVAYYKEHGNLECPHGFIDHDGIRLYDWCNFLRSQFKKCGRSFLTEEQFKLLDAIGMRWVSKHDVQWDEFFNCLAAYKKRTGNTDIGATYKEGDVPLGRWYRRQKELYRSGNLRKDRAERLLALGCNLKIEDVWERHYQAVKACAEHTGSRELPPDLRRWLKRQMSCLQKGTLPEDRVQKMLAIGITAESHGNETQQSCSAPAIHVSENLQTGNAVNG